MRRRVVALPHLAPHPMSYRGKRALDLAVASVGLAVAAPALAVAATFVRLETHGHALYRQRRGEWMLAAGLTTIFLAAALAAAVFALSGA